MRSTSFLVPLCILNCVGIILARCVTSKYEEGSGDSVQCSKVTLDMALQQPSANVAGIMIFDSSLRYIPPRSFSKYARTLVSLNIHRCGIVDVHQDAFEGLASLKKLSLSNNNITVVKEDWFKDTVYLAQLDLSFNAITNIEPAVFGRLPNLKRLDIGENRLSCLDPSALRSMGGIDKLRFSGNPLSLRCRGKLTLWLRDRGVNYKDDQNGKEVWLDSLLWLCAIDDPKVAESELRMQECVVLKLFNQLRSGLVTADSYPSTVSRQCEAERNLLTNCIGSRATADRAFTNGRMVQNLLLELRRAKTA